MDLQWAVNVLFAIVAGGGGWFLKSMYEAHQVLRGEVAADRAARAALELKIAEQYVTRSDMRRIEDKIDQVLKTLSEKADRPHI